MRLALRSTSHSNHHAESGNVIGAAQQDWLTCPTERKTDRVGASGGSLGDAMCLQPRLASDGLSDWAGMAFTSDAS